MTDYAIDVLDNLVRESLPSTIRESLPMIAPIYEDIQRTSIGVQRDQGIGRGWEVVHIFDTGVAGLVQSARPEGPGMTANTNFPQSWLLDSTSPDLTPFPSAVNAPHPGSIKRTLKLHMSTGNFNIPITWKQGDLLSASQIAQVARSIKGVAQLRALTEAQSFFMSSDNVLARIANYDSTHEADGYITFTVAPGSGRTQFFRIGMMVDVLDHSGSGSSATPNFGTSKDGTDVKNYGSDQSTYRPLIVADVNYLTGVITLAATDGGSLAAANLAGDAIEDDDFVVLRDCGTVDGREMRTWGLEDWIKSSGTLFGGAIDLSKYSQFASQVQSVSGPLTDTVMNRYVGGFFDAYPGASLDTIITTMGVTMKYLEQPSLWNNRFVYDRDGRPLDLHGGWSKVAYSFNGRLFKWIISPMCLGNTLYVVKFGDRNITRYVPPKLTGVTNEVGNDIEFLAPAAGSNSVFMVARAGSGAPQAMLEAPFWQYGMIAPIDVRSIKLTNLTEADLS